MHQTEEDTSKTAADHHCIDWAAPSNVATTQVWSTIDHLLHAYLCNATVIKYWFGGCSQWPVEGKVDEKAMVRNMTWQNQQNECAPSEDSDQLGHPPSLIRVFACAQWVAKDPSFLHTDSEDSDWTGRMPRLIWVFAGRTLILLVLSCRGSIMIKVPNPAQDTNRERNTNTKECIKYKMSLVTRKPVFGVFDQVRLKPACAATEAS